MLKVFGGNDRPIRGVSDSGRVEEPDLSPAASARPRDPAPPLPHYTQVQLILGCDQPQAGSPLLPVSLRNRATTTSRKGGGGVAARDDAALTLSGTKSPEMTHSQSPV